MKHDIAALGERYNTLLFKKKDLYNEQLVLKTGLIRWLDNIAKGECTEAHPAFIEQRSQLLSVTSMYEHAKRAFRHTRMELKNQLFSQWAENEIRETQRREEEVINIVNVKVSTYLDTYKQSKYDLTSIRSHERFTALPLSLQVSMAKHDKIKNGK